MAERYIWTRDGETVVLDRQDVEALARIHDVLGGELVFYRPAGCVMPTIYGDATRREAMEAHERRWGKRRRW